MSHTDGLHSSIALRLGLLDLAIELDVAEGETVALLGPNGSGKTTALRTLAGLLPIDAGRIELDGEVLDDPATEAWLPPEQRRIAVVFQDYLLFPNLSALDNVAFGLRRMGMQKRQARDIAAGWLERFGLTTHADNRPAHLSGGQAQRVALARALATEPRLLLLDEPLAALDAGTRVEMRSDLRRHLTTFPGIGVLVTHDPVDALALADRVVVLEAGRVVQTGTIPDIAAQPRSRYVAELVGVNLLRGHADGTTVTLTTDGRAHDRRTRTRRRLDPHPPQRGRAPPFPTRWQSPQHLGRHTRRHRPARRPRPRPASTDQYRSSPKSPPPPSTRSTSNMPPRSGSPSKQPRSPSTPPELTLRTCAAAHRPQQTHRQVSERVAALILLPPLSVRSSTISTKLGCSRPDTRKVQR